MLLFFSVKRHRNKKSKVVSVFNSACQQLKIHVVSPIQQSTGTDVQGKAHRFTLRRVTTVSALKQALSRVQLSGEVNTYVRCVQVFCVVMNMGCYKTTSSFFIIQRASTAILFWYQSTEEGDIWKERRLQKLEIILLTRSETSVSGKNLFHLISQKKSNRK